MKDITENKFQFSGDIPRHYDEYLGPMFFEPYAVEIANRIDPLKVNAVLELAAGTGRVTRHIRNRIAPAARLVATDISPDMLSVAKEKLAGESIEWQTADAGQLSFDDNQFDLVVCCFGLMFMPDRKKVYEEIMRVLKPGGKFLFSTWDELSKVGPSNLYRRITLEYLPKPVPPAYGLPFSMHDTEMIRQELKNSGFNDLIIQHIQKPCFSESARYAAEGLAMGGTVYTELMKTNPAAIPKITDELEKQIRENYGDKPMQAEMSAIIGEAVKI
jgi:ubiquinone/menaquinone biosynthesis C-methylase UbiE